MMNITNGLFSGKLKGTEEEVKNIPSWCTKVFWQDKRYEMVNKSKLSKWIFKHSGNL